VNRIFLNIIRLFSFRGKKLFFIQSIIGFKPKSIEVYKMALLHRSAQQKGPGGDVISNERLEFLGDAVLGTVIAMELFRLFPDKDEGALTKMRSRIVNRGLLNEVGLKLGLDKHIRCQSQLDLSQTHILGDAVEALIGAVFIDRGFAHAKNFVLDRIIKPHFNIFEIALTDSNYKSLMIEWGHKQRRHVEFSTTEVVSLPENPVLFYCKVFIDNEEVGDGTGTSKKDAQQNAARVAYQKVTSTDESIGF
jgi:ribonuclease III